jgi:hypothetical protein
VVRMADADLYGCPAQCFYMYIKTGKKWMICFDQALVVIRFISEFAGAKMWQHTINSTGGRTFKHPLTFVSHKTLFCHLVFRQQLKYCVWIIMSN